MGNSENAVTERVIIIIIESRDIIIIMIHILWMIVDKKISEPVIDRYKFHNRNTTRKVTYVHTGILMYTDKTE